MQNKYPIGGYAPRPYKIITKSGDIHDVHKYINDNEGRENIWCNTWYGHHIIGQDCEWYEEAAQGAVCVKASERVPVNGNLYHLNYKTKDTNFKTTGYYIDGKWDHQNHELLGWAPNLEWLDESTSKETDAVEFAEWILKEQWNQRSGLDWARYETIYSDISIKTTEQLYKLYQQSKK